MPIASNAFLTTRDLSIAELDDVVYLVMQSSMTRTIEHSCDRDACNLIAILNSARTVQLCPG